MHKILIFLFLLPAFYSIAQTESARKTVEQLCSPEFHGRGYVNGGDSIAAQFIKQQFAEMGCHFFNNEPFQPFTFTVNRFPGAMSVSIGGKELKPGADYIVSERSGGGTAVNLTPVFVTAEQMESEKNISQLVLDMSERIKKRSIIFVFDLPAYSKEGKANAESFIREFTSFAPVITLTDTKFTWSVSGGVRPFPWIEMQRGMISHESKGELVSYDIVQERTDHTANNVIAYVSAKKKSKKYFVYTAHYDHLGRMGQQTYFPGANDNASGTAMLLELARYFIQHPTEDVNIVFIAFAGEEAGLYGSKYFTEHPLFPLNKISFLFNIDIMGSGEEGATVVNATRFPKIFETLEGINNEKHYLVKIARRGEAANSDHYFFTEAGVPAFFLYTMGPNKHYHDIYDTYEELSFAEFDDLFHLLVDFGTKMTN